MGLFSPNIEKLAEKNDYNGLINAFSNKNESIRENAAYAFLGLTSTDEESELIITALERCIINNISSEIQQTAIRALGYIELSEKKSVFASYILKQQFETNLNKDTQEFCLKALKNRKAYSVLLDVLTEYEKFEEYINSLLFPNDNLKLFVGGDKEDDIEKSKKDIESTELISEVLLKIVVHHESRQLWNLLNQFIKKYPQCFINALIIAFKKMIDNDESIKFISEIIIKFESQCIEPLCDLAVNNFQQKKLIIAVSELFMNFESYDRQIALTYLINSIIQKHSDQNYVEKVASIIPAFGDEAFEVVSVAIENIYKNFENLNDKLKKDGLTLEELSEKKIEQIAIPLITKIIEEELRNKLTFNQLMDYPVARLKEIAQKVYADNVYQIPKITELNNALGFRKRKSEYLILFIKIIGKSLNKKHIDSLTIIAHNDSDSLVREKAVENIFDQDILAEFAKNDKEIDIRKAAVKKINDQNLLSVIAKNDRDIEIRLTAIKKLTDQRELAGIAKNDNELINICLEAVRKLTDQNILVDIAYNHNKLEVQIEAALKVMDLSQRIENLILLLFAWKSDDYKAFNDRIVDSLKSLYSQNALSQSDKDKILRLQGKTYRKHNDHIKYHDSSWCAQENGEHHSDTPSECFNL